MWSQSHRGSRCFSAHFTPSTCHPWCSVFERAFVVWGVLPLPWRYTVLSQVMSPIFGQLRLLRDFCNDLPGWIWRHRYGAFVLVRCGTRRWDYRKSAIFTTVHSGATRTSEPEKSLSLSWRKFDDSSVLFRTQVRRDPYTNLVRAKNENQVATWKTTNFKPILIEVSWNWMELLSLSEGSHYCKWWTTPTRSTTSSRTTIRTKSGSSWSSYEKFSWDEELKRVQELRIDESWRRRLIENQDTINELTARIQELQNEVNCMNDSRDSKMLNQYAVDNPTLPVSQCLSHLKDSSRILDTIGGEPIEFEWNIFPGFTTLQLVDKVQDFINKMGDPAQCQGRIIFMSMFNDIIWWTTDNEQECIANARLVSLFARRFPAGRWSCPRTWVRKEVVFCLQRKTRRRMGQSRWIDDDQIRRKRTTQFSEPRVHCPEEHSKAEEVETHRYSSVPMEIRLKLFCTIISVDKLSIFGAVSDVCEEYSTCQTITWRPVVERLSQQDRLIKICTDAGFLKTVEVGQYLMTKHTDEFSQFTEPVTCRE